MRDVCQRARRDRICFGRRGSPNVDWNALAPGRQEQGTVRWARRRLIPFADERDVGLVHDFGTDTVRAPFAHLAVDVDRPWSRSTLGRGDGLVDLARAAAGSGDRTSDAPGTPDRSARPDDR
jgi:hypothetical protein